MYPILYNALETTYTSEGEGRLKDLTYLKVTGNAVTMEYEVEGLYLATGPRINDINLEYQLRVRPYEGANPETFDIYYTKRDMQGNLLFRARHESYRLIGDPCVPFTATHDYEAVSKLRALGNAPGETGTTDYSFVFLGDQLLSVERTLEIKTPISLRAAVNQIAQKYELLVFCEGKTVYLVQPGSTYYTDWQNEVREHKNMTDFTEEADIGDRYNRVLAWYHADATDDRAEKTLWAVKPDAILPERYMRTYVLDVSSEYDYDEITQSELEYRAALYYASRPDMRTAQYTTSIGYISLRDMPQYYVDEPIKPLRPTRIAHSARFRATADRLTAWTWDALNEEYEDLTVGNPEPVYDDEVREKIKEAVEELGRQDTPAIARMQSAIDDISHDTSRPYNIWVGTLASYQNITTKTANTIYLIEEAESPA